MTHISLKVLYSSLTTTRLKSMLQNNRKVLETGVNDDLKPIYEEAESIIEDVLKERTAYKLARKPKKSLRRKK